MVYVSILYMVLRISEHQYNKALINVVFAWCWAFFPSKTIKPFFLNSWECIQCKYAVKFICISAICFSQVVETPQTQSARFKKKNIGFFSFTVVSVLNLVDDQLKREHLSEFFPDIAVLQDWDYIWYASKASLFLEHIFESQLQLHLRRCFFFALLFGSHLVLKPNKWFRNSCDVGVVVKQVREWWRLPDGENIFWTLFWLGIIFANFVKSMQICLLTAFISFRAPKFVNSEPSGASSCISSHAQL